MRQVAQVLERAGRALAARLREVFGRVLAMVAREVAPVLVPPVAARVRAAVLADQEAPAAQVVVNSARFQRLEKALHREGG